MLEVWSEAPEAQERIGQLLSEDGLPPPMRGDDREAALKKRIDDFDKDDGGSLARLVAAGLDSLGSKHLLLPSRDQISRLRQKLLEHVFLPGEDEVLWGGDEVLSGLDTLAVIESQRRAEMENITRVLAIESLGHVHDDAQQLFGHPAAERVDQIATLDRDSRHLYKVAYMGIRICVSVHDAGTPLLHPLVAQVRRALTHVKKQTITHRLDTAQGPAADRPRAILQLLNSLFAPYFPQQPGELVDRAEILKVRRQVYVSLMDRTTAVTAADREIFQTQLLGAARLGSWPGHIRQSLSEYFDKVEQTRRMHAEMAVLPLMPSTPRSSSGPSQKPPLASPLPPRSILKSRKSSKLALDADKDRPPPPPTVQSAPAMPPPPPICGDYVAHPALRNLNMNIDELAKKGLALPAVSAGDSADSDAFSNAAVPEDGSDGGSDLWPSPLRLLRAHSIAAMGSPSPTTTTLKSAAAVVAVATSTIDSPPPPPPPLCSPPPATAPPTPSVATAADATARARPEGFW